jgi:hypothetical protein
MSRYRSSLSYSITVLHQFTIRKVLVLQKKSSPNLFQAAQAAELIKLLCTHPLSTFQPSQQRRATHRHVEVLRTRHGPCNILQTQEVLVRHNELLLVRILDPHGMCPLFGSHCVYHTSVFVVVGFTLADGLQAPTI